MEYEVVIERLNDQAFGVGYINSKVVFVENAMPGDIVKVEIIKERKNILEGKIKRFIKYSSLRVDSMCKYASRCGGCKLATLDYLETIKYKKEKLEHILKKFGNLDLDIPIVISNNIEYRNKISLHIKNYKIGYYQASTNELVEITKCNIAMPVINEFLKYLKDFKIKDGSVSIRCNDTNELLIYIKTKDNIVIPEIPLNVVGIVLNDKVLKGNYYITEIVNGYKYNVSYNSFFQVNLEVCAKMFDLLDKYILKNSNVLDLYCGVGTLGLSVAKNEKMVYGIEIVSNAIKNAWDNAKLNNISNVKYYCGDVSKVISRIEDKIDVIITDPPRCGLDKKTIEVMMKLEPKEIIYISCDPITLARDLKLLDGYSLKYITGLDMFSYTNHVECVSVLYRKSLEK